MNVIYLETVTSTNDLSKILVQKKPEIDEWVVRTDFQKEGRGRQGNGWESEHGKNVLMSLVIQPKNLHPSQQFIINQLISCALYDFLHEEIPNDCLRIKWPNDLYVGNKKIAGTLIEHLLSGNKIHHTIIGIGLNINQIAFHNAPNPTSLQQITNKNYDVADVAYRLAEKIFQRHNAWNQNEQKNLQNQYEKRLFHYHEKQRFLIDNQEVEATILGVTENGLLRLSINHGEERHFELNSLKYIIH